jgi:hypothetical protein
VSASARVVPFADQRFMGITMFNASQRQSNLDNDAHQKTQIELRVCFKRSDYHLLFNELPNRTA